MTVYLIGLGVGGFNTIPLIGLEVLRRVDRVFIEVFSNPISKRDLEKIFEICKGKDVIIVDREKFEREEVIFKYLDLNGDIAIISGGDPLIATTHQQLLLDLIKHGKQVRVINASSIITAAIGRSGLHIYKFGPIGTIMRPHIAPLESVFQLLVENLRKGLHTLLLLEYDYASRYIMTPNEAISLLAEAQGKFNSKLPKKGTPVLILSKIGSEKEKLIGIKWGEKLEERIEGPAVIIFPGKLHFTERDFIREVFKLDV